MGGSCGAATSCRAYAPAVPAVLVQQDAMLCVLGAKLLISSLLSRTIGFKSRGKWCKAVTSIKLGFFWIVFCWAMLITINMLDGAFGTNPLHSKPSLGVNNR